MKQDISNGQVDQPGSGTCSIQEATTEKVNAVACSCHHPVLSFTMYSMVGVALLLTTMAFAFPQAVAPMAELLPDGLFGSQNHRPKIGAHCCDSIECACHAEEVVEPTTTTMEDN